MLRFVSLASGSSGNCYYIGDEFNALIIDAGIGGRTLKKRLSECGLSHESIRMILVTHDHIDHIKHLGSIAQRHSLPVFTSAKLHERLAYHYCTRGCLGGLTHILEPYKEYNHLGFTITPFIVPHDAVETLGYVIKINEVKIVIMTDIGERFEALEEMCSDADYLIIESNYDLDMLLTGSYSPDLKRRILEGKGHLSNDNCASIVKTLYHNNLKKIFLCHLSENNNTPELAYNTTSKALKELGADTTSLHCLPRRSPSDVFELE